MKKLFLSIASLMLIAGSISTYGATKAAKSNAKTVKIVCSQGFQGPELWDIHYLPVDKDGYITIFNGKDFAGWRGYGRSDMPSRWVIDNGCIHFMGSQEGDKVKGKEGGDIIFAHKFKNFELSIDWKICKGGNSGIFYLAQELDKDGTLQSIVVSGLESQVLDNVNHPDAKAGKDGDRQSTSLYDLIPAKPQNAKPYEQWNTTKIRVENGHVTHFQNGVAVVDYQLWTPQWVELVAGSKFGPGWQSAFQAFTHAGGPNHEGFIGLQDHGDNVWYRNIKVKLL